MPLPSSPDNVVTVQPAPFPVGATVRGHSGHTHKIKALISERRDPLLCVYRASCVDKPGGDFIVKNTIPGEFEYQQELQKPLASCPNLRTVADTIPDFELLVYHFLLADLLQLMQRGVFSAQARRRTLTSALTGLADLHERNIIHTGKFYPKLSSAYRRACLWSAN